MRLVGGVLGLRFVRFDWTELAFMAASLAAPGSARWSVSIPVGVVARSATPPTEPGATTNCDAHWCTSLLRGTMSVGVVSDPRAEPGARVAYAPP